MKALVREFWQEEEGLQTVEMILILIVIVGLIGLFQTNVTTWFNAAKTKVDSLINAVT